MTYEATMLDPLLEIRLGQAWCSFAFKKRNAAKERKQPF